MPSLAGLGRRDLGDSPDDLDDLEQISVGAQGMRFFVVALLAFGVNQLGLVLFIDTLHWRKVISQAIAIALVTPLNFLGNKLWSFRT